MQELLHAEELKGKAEALVVTKAEELREAVER